MKYFTFFLSSKGIELKYLCRYDFLLDSIISIISVLKGFDNTEGYLPAFELALEKWNSSIHNTSGSFNLSASGISSRMLITVCLVTPISLAIYCIDIGSKSISLTTSFTREDICDLSS